MKTPGASRDVIPIWKTAGDASASAELKSIKVATYSREGRELTSWSLMAEFDRDRSLGVAAELLNIALLEKNDIALKVSAGFIVGHEAATPDLLYLSRMVLGVVVPQVSIDSEVNIATLRNKLKASPNNPLVWANLARAYVIVNEQEKAEKAMLGALHYANNHRWVCRVASRLYVHFGDPAKALRVLHRNPNLKIDPWLLSTELAVSRLAGRPLKNWNYAKKLVESPISALHLSELASSIGTSEIIAGANKKAKVYFKQALVSPNSNSLAQVKWADRSFGLGFSKQINNSLASVSSAYEARHWECYEQKDMVRAIEYAQMWWKEEPYSIKPPQAISFVASLVNDLQLIHDTARIALERNPDDTTLRLNDIYARACICGVFSGKDGEVSEKDIVYLKGVMNGSDKDYAAHAYANAGLINYRLGYLEQGREFYNAAKVYYEKYRNDATLFLLLNHYREALVSEAVWSGDVLTELLTAVRQPKTLMSPAAEFYLGKVNEISQNAEDWAARFSRPFYIKETSGLIKAAKESVNAIDVSKRFWLPPTLLERHGLHSLLKVDFVKDLLKQ